MVHPLYVEVACLYVVTPDLEAEGGQLQPSDSEIRSLGMVYARSNVSWRCEGAPSPRVDFNRVKSPLVRAPLIKGSLVKL